MTVGEDLWLTLKIGNETLNPAAQLVHPTNLVNVPLISPFCLYMKAAVAVVEGSLFITYLGCSGGEIKHGCRRRLLVSNLLARLLRLRCLGFRFSEGLLLGIIEDAGRGWLASSESHVRMVEEVSDG